eukprot:NODE_19182_length_855_cov_8.490385.p1 GENE.NODE_19182_length_855_cov_8.490385~~NODE_19182_length_855_cov_8.490385.p1  ORF type:complete len:177 (-),score=34.98 NODE_19182_length_855_cov_8.490385:234-764(-)
MASAATGRQGILGRQLHSGGQGWHPNARAAYEAWHAAVINFTSGESTDEASMLTLMAPHVAVDAVFKSPTYKRAWVGRQPLLLLLSTVGGVFGTSFKYRREWVSADGRDWALEFTAKVGDLDVVGVDLVRCNEDGKICEFEVVTRPLTATQKLKEIMGTLVPANMQKYGIPMPSKL